MTHRFIIVLTCCSDYYFFIAVFKKKKKTDGTPNPLFLFLFLFIQTSELGVTEHVEGDPCKFALWVGRTPTSDNKIVLKVGGDFWADALNPELSAF